MENEMIERMARTMTATLRHHGVEMHPEDIRGLAHDALAECGKAMGEDYIRGLERAAIIAEHYIINGNSIHPDIPADKIDPQARMIAHTACQHVAEGIRAAKGDKI